MQLRITLRLLTGDHLIGCISEEALQTVEERIVITGAYLSYELPDLERGLGRTNTRVKWKEIFHETLFHFPVRETLAGRYQIQDRNP